MSVENQEEKTVEVLGVPNSIGEELLTFYFENKRRSGGGSLISLEKHSDRVVLVYEEAEEDYKHQERKRITRHNYMMGLVAARVLSKGSHVFHNAELTVRKPASKDQQRLLLRGIGAGTGTELVELYVENVMEMDENDYTLYPSPGRDLILIQLHQPLSKDFENLRAMISKKPLDGSKITLEQVEQPDSILVENLHPGITTDTLSLYFESRRGGDQEVKEVIMISETTARVSFADFNSVNHVVTLSHKLENAELVVRPYFAFLQPAESIASQTSENGPTDDGTDGSPQNSTDSQIQSSSPASVSANKSSHQTALEPVDVVMEDLTVHKEPLSSHIAIPDPVELALPPVAVKQVKQEADVVMQDLAVHKEPLSSHIAIRDPAKLALLQISTFAKDIKQAHPDSNIQVKDDGVHIAGPDNLAIQQLRNTVWEFLGNIAQAHLTFDQEKAQFLANREVKERLLQTMNEKGLPTVYTVSDSVLVLTSLSLNSVSEAGILLKSQICDFSIPVEREYESELYSAEWSAFLQSLGFCSARVAQTGGVTIEVLTLKGMENEMQAKILKHLTTLIERETVIPMAPGMLKFMQIHCHQLLTEMDQVSIVPLEGEDCGLKINGRPGACKNAAELLQAVVDSVYTRTITVNRPGVARFLVEDDGTSILGEMQVKFQVYVSLDKVRWEPLKNEDIFEAAWESMSHHNFQRVPTDSPDRGLIEEAKKIVSAIDGKVKTDQSSLNQPIHMKEGESEQETDIFEDAPRALVEGDVAGGPLLSSDGALGPNPSNLEEEAQLSLAIQYSMERTERSLAERSLPDEDEELQRVLELSRKMEYGGPSVPTKRRSQSDKAVHMSLQDAIKAANTAEVFVCATYNPDLIRVDIALAKKVNLRQVEEKVEHKSLKNLSELHKRCVEVIKRKHAVEIQIQGTRATISGFKDFVEGALTELDLLLKKISKMTSDTEILRSVEWVWHDPGSQEMTPYAPKTTVFIENAWKMKQKKIDILLNNQPHIINFEKMQEFNVASGKSVKISRKMSSADLTTAVPDEDYSLLSGLPEASRVNEDSAEFQEVVKYFYENIEKYHNKIRIIKVEKLTNLLLYKQYELKKGSISQSATEPEIERTLYHGTSESSVKEICIHGFNRSFCGKNATVYGQGVYFAVKSALSVQDTYSPPNADGHKFVFVTKVLTGDFTKGCHSMRTAPLKETADIPLRYDSVTDNISDPSLFVIFNDTQAYPEYIITCQKIHR